MPETQNPRVKVGDNRPPSTAELLKEKHAAIFERAKKWVRRAKAADLAPKTLEDCRKLEELYKEGRDIANDADRIRTAEKEPHLKAGREVDAVFGDEIISAVGADSKKRGLAQNILQAAADRRAAITQAEQRAKAAAAEKAQQEADRLAEQQKRQEEAGKVREADVTGAKVEAVDRKADQLAAAAAAPMEQASRDRTAGGHSVSVGMKAECTGVVRADLDLEALRPYFKQEHLIAAVDARLKMDTSPLKGAAIRERAVGRVR